MEMSMEVDDRVLVCTVSARLGEVVTCRGRNYELNPVWCRCRKLFEGEWRQKFAGMSGT